MYRRIDYYHSEFVRNVSVFIHTAFTHSLTQIQKLISEPDLPDVVMTNRQVQFSFCAEAVHFPVQYRYAISLWRIWFTLVLMMLFRV